MKQTVSILVFLFFAAVSLNAQTNEFTYQGKLTDNGSPANGSYDIRFQLYDVLSDGTPITSTLEKPGVLVANGTFSVVLDFSDTVFNGADRYLEIAVKPAGGPTYTVLSPRQKILSSPYAIKSKKADESTTAASAAQLGGVTADQYVLTTDPRMTDARTPTAGSGSYIQNQTAIQQIAEFNINGTGKANILDANRFESGGFRVLSILGSNNLFAGVFSGPVNTGSSNTFLGKEAGEANTSGSENVFVGYRAGNSNTTAGGNTFVGNRSGNSTTIGVGNSFFGTNSGATNTTGLANSFFGSQAGFANTIGQGNSFFGSGAGMQNTVANSNSFFGNGAGAGNTTGQSNSYFGSSSGQVSSSGSRNSMFGVLSGQNNTGGDNAFFGVQSGQANTTGTANTFYGFRAGDANTIGNRNTIIGSDADVATNNLSYATAIGAEAVVSASNTVVLGRSADTVQIPGNLTLTGSFTGNIPAGSANYIQNQNAGPQAATNFNISGTGTANIINGITQFNLNGNRILTGTGSNNTFAGFGAGESNTVSISNSFFGSESGRMNTSGGVNTFFGAFSGEFNTVGNENTFIGGFAGIANTTGNSNTLVGYDADLGAGNLSHATAIGADAVVSSSNSVVLGRPGGEDTVRIPGTLRVTGGLDAEIGGGGQVIVGDTTSTNIAIDGNEIMARDGGANATLAINADGGNVNLIQGGTGNVGIGTSTPDDKLHVSGIIRVTALGAAGSTSICRNSSFQLSTCSSSLRYKTNFASFLPGLDIVNRLKPITFDWKEGGMRDLGLGAEDVAAIEPLLVTYNAKGEVEGVKYDRIGVVLVNAIKEQQALIEKQRSEIEHLKERFRAVDELKGLVCAINASAPVCREEK